MMSVKKLNSRSIRPGKSGRNSRFYIGLAAAIAGLVIGGGVLFNVWYSQRSAAAPVSQALVNSRPLSNNDPLVQGTPVHISIPSVSIDLKVIPGFYYPKTKSWTLSLNDAQYAVMTAKANNKGGDTFIYAHYRWHVFYNLPKIKPGAEATVKTDNGHTFTYTFRYSTITTPNDTSLFTYQGKPILILQTCTGLWYQNRQLFVLDLTGVDGKAVKG
jgi:LPXTG-site transpeptidase (sortase) family protein